MAILQARADGTFVLVLKASKFNCTALCLVQHEACVHTALLPQLCLQITNTIPTQTSHVSLRSDAAICTQGIGNSNASRKWKQCQKTQGAKHSISITLGMNICEDTHLCIQIRSNHLGPIHRSRWRWLTLVLIHLSGSAEGLSGSAATPIDRDVHHHIHPT